MHRLLCSLVFVLLFAVVPSRVEASRMYFVAELHQRIDEMPDAFLWRLGQYMAERQARTGHESSANICKSDSGKLGVMVFTSSAKNWSKVSNGCPLTHPHMTAETIHSHTNSRWSRFLSSGFSPQDYNLGSGYLVVGPRMYYQHGHGTQTQVVMPEEGVGYVATRKAPGELGDKQGRSRVGDAGT